jgi:hypothetical protein
MAKRGLTSEIIKAGIGFTNPKEKGVLARKA